MLTASVIALCGLATLVSAGCTGSGERVAQSTTSQTAQRLSVAPSGLNHSGDAWPRVEGVTPITIKLLVHGTDPAAVRCGIRDVNSTALWHSARYFEAQTLDGKPLPLVDLADHPALTNVLYDPPMADDQIIYESPETPEVPGHLTVGLVLDRLSFADPIPEVIRLRIRAEALARTIHCRDDGVTPADVNVDGRWHTFRVANPAAD